MPSALAMYIAASASRISVSALASALITSSSITAMPMLQRCESSFSGSWIGSVSDLDQPLGGVGGLLGVADALEQDRELVAAEAGGGVRGADAVRQAVGDLDQHAVAGVVAEAVVDES